MNEPMPGEEPAPEPGPEPVESPAAAPYVPAAAGSPDTAVAEATGADRPAGLPYPAAPAAIGGHAQPTAVDEDTAPGRAGVRTLPADADDRAVLADAPSDTSADTPADGVEPGPAAPAGDPAADTGADPDAPAPPAPLGVPCTPTGSAGVDELLVRLADADDLAADGHLELYENVHRDLRDTLTALDQRPGLPAPSTPYDNRS